MVKRAVSFAAVVVAGVLAALSLWQVSFVQGEFPAGTKVTATLWLGEAGLSREQVTDRFARLAREYALEAYLVAPDPADPTIRALYSLGSWQPAEPQKMASLVPLREWVIYPASALTTENLNASFAFNGGADAVGAVKAWLATEQIRATWLEAGPVQMLTASLVYGGAGTAIAAVIALAIASVTAWQFRCVQPRAIRLLAGMSPWRLWRQDTAAYLRLTVGSWLWVAALTVTALAVTKGWDNAVQVGALLLFHLAWVAAMSVLVGALVAVWTSPPLEAVARRRPLHDKFELVGEALKVGTLVVGLVALPGALSQISSAADQANNEAMVKPAARYVSITVGGVASAAIDDLVPKYGEAMRRTDRAGEVGFAEFIPFDAAASATHGVAGIFLANTHYLATFKARGCDNGGSPSVTPSLIAAAEAALAGAVSNPSGGLAGNGLRSCLVATPLYAPNPTGYGFIRVDRSLLVISQSITDTLSNDQLTTALTNGNIMFSGDAVAFLANARAAGLSQTIRSTNRVTDAAMLSAQDAFARDLPVAEHRPPGDRARRLRHRHQSDLRRADRPQTHDAAHPWPALETDPWATDTSGSPHCRLRFCGRSSHHHHRSDSRLPDGPGDRRAWLPAVRFAHATLLGGSGCSSCSAPPRVAEKGKETSRA